MALFGALRPSPVAYCADALSQDAYVWQRRWDDPVRDAVSRHGGAFERLLLLGAEIRWCDAGPEVVEVPVDFASVPRSAGLALRIGPYRGRFASNDAAARRIGDTAERLVRGARSAGIEPRELQLDFDAATRQLDGYRRWIEALRARLDVPITVTALPAWLGYAAFRRLVRDVDGFVLQVHSLERPSGPSSPVVLCDTERARTWVHDAATYGVPFRVALPTYGYVVAFDADGRFSGLAAEGAPRSWPPGTKLRAVRSDPAALAALVDGWMRRHPALLTGLIWYRLPTARDELNWRFATLAAVMRGRTPAPRRRVAKRMSGEGLVELELVNEGDADASPYVTIDVRTPGDALCDARAGFRWTRSGATIRFEAVPEMALRRLAPGERRLVGWIRADHAAKWRVDVVDRD